MAAKKRLSKDERRESIVAAAIPLFAKNGFKGTTTKELAAAASVSEALLYKHFPSKESMYEEIQKVCFQKRQDYVEALEQLEPSTANLVMCIWFLMQRTISEGMMKDKVIGDALPRLVLTSLLEDGSFAKVVLVNNSTHWRDPMYACLRVAKEAGDITNVPTDEVVTWLIHHIAFSCLLMKLPKKDVVDYGMPVDQLIDHATVFALKGLGMSDKLIEKLYKPAEFSTRFQV